MRRFEQVWKNGSGRCLLKPEQSLGDAPPNEQGRDMKMAQNAAHVGIDVSQAELVVYIEAHPGLRGGEI